MIGVEARIVKALVDQALPCGDRFLAVAEQRVCRHRLEPGAAIAIFLRLGAGVLLPALLVGRRLHPHDHS